MSFDPSPARRPRCALCALLLAPFLAGMPSPAVGQDAGSPAAALEAEREAVLAAERLEDVIDFVPAEHRERVGAMSEEDKGVTLARWKAGLEAARYEEWVAGDRAAVLLESEPSASPIIMIMELDGDRWVTRDQTQLFSGVTGARGSFAATGAVEAALERGHIQQDYVNGIPVLTLRNELAEALGPDADVPGVTLVLEECLAPGEVDLGVREAGNVRIGSSFQAGGEAGDAVVFRHEPSGTLRVETVDEDRFSGSFELSVGTDARDGDGEADGGPGEPAADGAARATRVTVSGTIENARNSCPEPEAP